MGRKFATYLSIWLLSLAAAVYATAAVPVRIAGTVTDSSSGEPVPGAVLRLDENYLWAVTDENGKYVFDKVQPGSYGLEISCLGYVDIRTELKVTVSKGDLDFKISVNSLALQEVVVTAETSRDNINTTRSIGRNALDHLQMSGMSNVAALLPGGKTVNPDLTSEAAISLRGGGVSAGNAAFGTAIEVDGVRLGGNASFSGMDGVGTRGVSTENIESVEILTGVPSAEYGDLNSGMVRVKTRKGKSPLNVVFSINPRTRQASLSKGIDLGASKGTLNLSGELVEATSKLSSPYTSYTRRGFTLDYSNTFARKLRLEAGLSGNIGGMNSKEDPDTFSDEYSTARDNLLTPHFKAVWLLNKSWVTNLTLDGSISYHDQKSHAHSYYSFASTQPAVHSEVQGYFFSDALPLTFYSDQITDSRELDYAASLKYNCLKRWGGVKSTLKAGLSWKADGNIGKGEYYLDPALAANGYRPRPYSEYPYMHNLAFFAEDDLSVPIGKTTLEVRAGLRLEDILLKDSEYSNTRTLSPRFNAKWTLSEHFAIRGGWGIAGKLPGFYILYPRQEYRDIQTFGFSWGNAGNSSYVYYTQPYKMVTNPDLKWQRNYNSEIAVETQFGGVSVSLTAFRNVTRDPYQYMNVYTPFSYNIMSLPEGYKVPDSPQLKVDENGRVGFRGPGEEDWTYSVLRVQDRSFAASRQQMNGDPVTREGLELVADFPEIKPVRTQFRLDAAYTRTRNSDEHSYYYYNNGWSHTSLPNRSYQYVGIYPGGNSVSNGRETRFLDANFTAITHIPSARLIVTCRVEASLLRRMQNLSTLDGKTYAYKVDRNTLQPQGGDIYDGDSYTAVRPVAYLDLDGNVHPFTDAEAADPEFARLIVVSPNAYTFKKDGYDPYFSANLSLTKEIGNHVSLSFFVNNFTNSRKYVKSYATGVGAIFTPDFYYGLTCRVKL